MCVRLSGAGSKRSAKKFNAYSLAKWNRKSEITLRDAMRLTHPKPDNNEQRDLWAMLLNDSLPVPETRETMLSSGISANEVYTKLLSENKAGPQAILKNLKTMVNAGVDTKLIQDALGNINGTKVLPYEFIAAEKYAPSLSAYIGRAMLKCLDTFDRIPGKTVVLVDVSGSMNSAVSTNNGRQSETMRVDAAYGLAMMAREIFEECRIVSFSDSVIEIDQAHRGFALKHAIDKSQRHSGTRLSATVDHVNKHIVYDRIVIITDEASTDGNITTHTGQVGYVINVASNSFGVGYKTGWYHINGWSEHILRYIAEAEGYSVPES